MDSILILKLDRIYRINQFSLYNPTLDPPEAENKSPPRHQDTKENLWCISIFESWCLSGDQPWRKTLRYFGIGLLK